MKLKLSLLALLPFFFGSSVRAMLIHEIRVNANAFIVSQDLSEARSDANPDASTVRVTLSDNPLAKRWELRFWGWQTGTRDLTSGLDVTTGTDLSIRLQKFPKGHPMAVRAIYIDGEDVRDLQYIDTTDMVEFKFRPVKPVISASHSGEITAFAGVVFPYSGMKADPATIRYAPPVIIGNVVCADVGRAQHPSSDLLLGKAIRVNGVEGQRADFQFLIGSRYALEKGFSLDQMRGYLDGTTPASGFGYMPPAEPGFSMNMGDGAETFRRISVYNMNFSARDIQVGVFPDPLRFTGINLEAGGVRLTWNPRSNKTYALESFPAIGASPNALGSGLTGPEYLDPQPANSNPARFYRLREQ